MNEVKNEKWLAYFLAGNGMWSYHSFITSRRILMVSAKSWWSSIVLLVVIFIMTFIVFIPLIFFGFVNFIYLYIYFILSIIICSVIACKTATKALPQHVQRIKKITELIPNVSQDEHARLLKELAELADNHKEIEIPLTKINSVKISSRGIIISTERGEGALRFLEGFFEYGILDLNSGKRVRGEEKVSFLENLFRQLNVTVL